MDDDADDGMHRGDGCKCPSSSSTVKRNCSAVGVAFLVILFVAIVEWHSSNRPISWESQQLLSVVNHEQQQLQAAAYASRHLESSSSSSLETTNSGDSSNSKNDDVVPDGDPSRDKTCRDYLFNFLNGSTDARDECVGFYNAWQAADCQTDDANGDGNGKTTGIPLWYSVLQYVGILQRQHPLDNGTVVDDKYAIDDYYENWECCSSITDFYSRHCQQNQLDAFQLLGITMGLVICGVSKSILKLAGLQWIPDAGAFIVVGSIVGGIVRLFSSQSFKNSLIFDNDLFLQILLPPIIFEASLSIDKKAFRRDIFPILTLAIFGTFFCALAIGYGTYFLTSWGSSGNLPLLDSLVFGALMSSIDPVATLSILSSNGVNHRDTLYNLIFGESLLNDGVAIVLFNSLVQHFGDATDIDSATVHEVLRDFVFVTTASLIIGVVCGAVCTVYFYTLRGKHSPVTEVAMFFTWALIPYYIADGFQCSGIIAIMVMGFMLDYYVVGSDSLSRRLEGGEEEVSRARDAARWIEYMGASHHSPAVPRGGPYRTFLSHVFSGKGHIAEMSRHHVGFVAEVIANLMETAIFGYLGLFLFNDKSLNVKMLSSGLFSCVASRAVMVAGASLLINLFVFLDVEEFLGRLWLWLRNRHNRNSSFNLAEDGSEKLFLDKKTQMILFSAGVRGAVSYALVQNIPIYNAVTKHGSKFKTELRAMTSASIVVLIFGFGAMTYYLIKRSSIGRTTSSENLTDHLLLSAFAVHNDDEVPDADYQQQQDSGLHNGTNEMNQQRPTSAALEGAFVQQNFLQRSTQ
jgi:NhaP-type Na+/H+ or K+/H+ antiporter